eukprot:scaffold199292_cov19-Tisochrysis_lutea.AAC.1
MHAQGRRPYLTLPARENNFVDEKTGLKVADESWYCPKYHHDVTLIMLLVLLRVNKLFMYMMKNDETV